MSEAALSAGGVAEPAWKPWRGPFQRWPHMADFMVAVFAFLMTLLIWSQGTDADGFPVNTLGGVTALLLAFIGNFSLLWRRSHPVQVHALVLGLSILVHLGPVNDGLFALVFSLYSLGRYTHDDRTSILGMLAALVFVVTDLFILGVADIGGVIAAGLVMLLWYVGRRLKFRGEYLQLLEERARYLEQQRDEDARRAVTEERTRIARELHDIVAHQVSLMTIQAGAAKTVADSDPAAAIEAMAAVESAGRQALSEMRHLLTVLRPGNHSSNLNPQPGLDDLGRLVGEVRGAGLQVEFVQHKPVEQVPARVQLAVYRIVQEALTNVMKHARKGVVASVTIEPVNDGMSVRVVDDGHGIKNSEGGGFGIAGMKERAESLGGTLTAGPGEHGGFEVSAFLPVTEEPL